MHKLRIIFDATILQNGIHKNACRTGIYVVAFNLLKEFIKQDADIALYCNYKCIEQLENMLNKYFKDNNFKIISEIPYNKLTKLYCNLRNFRTELRDNNKNIQKFLLQIFLIFVSLIVKLHQFIHKYTISLNDYDVYFSPAYSVPKIIKRNKNLDNYILLHDTIPIVLPEYFSGYTEESWFYKLVNSLNAKDYYFANSDATKNDFLKYCSQIDSKKIYTTLLACDEKFKPTDLETIAKAREKYNIPVDIKYVFSLCTLEPRKNLIRAVKTFIKFIQKNNIDDMYFVLGGGHWEKFVNILEQEIENIGDYKNKIIKAGYIDDEDLAPLYSGAEWFVYTSQYEGFGLPLLEAMSCGCPVISSNNSSLPEVVGDAGIMIDYDSDEQHIEAYEKYYFNKELREENRQKGLQRAKQFSWKKCVDEMFEIIKRNENA